MRYLVIEGVTGHEKAIASAIRDDLIAIGVPESAIRFDDVHKRIPLPTETGNLIVDLPGTRPGKRLLFSTHLDTLPLCAGAKPKREGDRIVSDGTTALGGDNRTGCALLVALVETLLTDILQMDPGSKPNLTRFPFVDKMAWPIRRAKRHPGGPTRLGGLNGMVFFVIETHLSRRFQSDARHTNPLRR